MARQSALVESYEKKKKMISELAKKLDNCNLAHSQIENALHNKPEAICQLASFFEEFWSCTSAAFLYRQADRLGSNAAFRKLDRLAQEFIQENNGRNYTRQSLFRVIYHYCRQSINLSPIIIEKYNDFAIENLDESFDALASQDDWYGVQEYLRDGVAEKRYERIQSMHLTKLVSLFESIQICVETSVPSDLVLLIGEFLIDPSFLDDFKIRQYFFKLLIQKKN